MRKPSGFDCGFSTEHSPGHEVLWCDPCKVFVFPCEGERHVCPSVDVAELEAGDWTEIAVGEEAVADLEKRAAGYREATERSRSVREDLVLTCSVYGGYHQFGQDGLCPCGAVQAVAAPIWPGGLEAETVRRMIDGPGVTSEAIDQAGRDLQAEGYWDEHPDEVRHAEMLALQGGPIDDVALLAADVPPPWEEDEGPLFKVHKGGAL